MTLLSGLYFLNRDLGSKDPIVGASYWLGLSVMLNAVVVVEVLKSVLHVGDVWGSGQYAAIACVVVVGFVAGFAAFSWLLKSEDSLSTETAERARASKTLACAYVSLSVLGVFAAFMINAIL